MTTDEVKIAVGKIPVGMVLPVWLQWPDSEDEMRLTRVGEVTWDVDMTVEFVVDKVQKAVDEARDAT